jgi:hypothetical protein
MTVVGSGRFFALSVFLATDALLAAPISAVDAVLGTLLAAFEDYTLDNRGDVGSWVRIAAMKALQVYLCTMRHLHY